MKKIIVLGAGLVGGVMAVDLSKNHNVTSVDISKKNLDNIPSDNIKKNKSSLLKPISLKSIGTPQQVAGTVKFLCSEDASYITGENIVISGGKYIVQK